jgi:hypothetical protein
VAPTRWSGGAVQKKGVILFVCRWFFYTILKLEVGDNPMPFQVCNGLRAGGGKGGESGKTYA